MACTDCLNNCGNTRTTDKCVEYTGPDIEWLGICTGDSLFEIEAIILEKLEELADGTGILLSDVTIGCTFLTDILNGGDKTLANLMQMLVTANCSLRTMVQSIQTQLALPFTVAAPCLVLPTSPTRDDVLAAAVVKLCALSTDVTTIKNNYVKATDLCSMVNACLASGGLVQEYTKMPKNVAMAYMGTLSVFDSTGKGLSTYGYDKVYICNGNNGTQDLRGRALVGANTNVVGPALDAAVDPALSANAGYGIAQNTKKGAYTHTLTITESAPHSHSVSDPGHTHTTGFGTDCFSGNNFCNVAKLDTNTYNKTSNSSTTGITIGSAGGGQPHNNTQPSHGVVWIIYIP